MRFFVTPRTDADDRTIWELTDTLNPNPISPRISLSQDECQKEANLLNEIVSKIVTSKSLKQSANVYQMQAQKKRNKADQLELAAKLSLWLARELWNKQEGAQ